MQNPLTQELAHFAAQLDYSDIPRVVREDLYQTVQNIEDLSSVTELTRLLIP
jgi:hypothetical protein